MKYATAAMALGFFALSAPADAQEVIVPAPTVTYYAPSVPVTTYYPPPVTTYYAPSVPVTTYYAPAPVTAYYAPAVAYRPAVSYYVPPRVARRWARNGYWW